MRFITALLAFVFALSSTASEKPPETADLILYNGGIWTVDEAKPQAEALAIRGDRIVAVGTSEEILKLREKETRAIDLQGAFALPGFNDNHVHFASAAQFLEFNIMNVSNQAEFVERVKNVIAGLPKGEWITGGFWGAYDQWTPGSAGGQKREPFTPDMSLVEELTRDYPMFIRKFDDSEFAVNAAAMKSAGISLEKTVTDVEFACDQNGKFTGIVRGKDVLALFNSKIPERVSRERRLRQSRRALEVIRKFGVTNISDMSDEEQLEIYRELRKSNELTVRVHYRYPLDRWKDLEQKDIRVGSGDEWIRLGALKGHIDGIMGNSTARFFEPYSHDSANRGKWRPLMVDEQGNFVEGKFLKYMLDADRAGLQLTVHAIGDEANHLLLNYLEQLHKQNGDKDRRFRLVHAQVIASRDFERLGKLKVVAEVQPFHLSDDMRWMEERIGKERCKSAYAFQSILQSGATLSFGTDWPGTSAAEYPINPMLGLYAAVTRKTVTGEPKEGWFPEQKISIEEAIRAYTLNTAYANFEEKIKGSITPGKLADITVLSKNLLKIPPEEILKTEIVYTIVGGSLVYPQQQ